MSLLGLIGRRVPTLLLLVAGLLYVLGSIAVFILCRWWLAYPLAAVAGGWWVVHRYGPATVAAVALFGVLLVALALAYWHWLGPDSFERRLASPVRSMRRRRYYRRRWLEAMDGCKLVRAGVDPRLMSVRGGRTVDELLVHLAPGSVLDDWREAAPRLASALEVRSVRVRKDGPRDVLLLVRHSAVGWHESEAAVESEVAETTEQLVAEREARAVESGLPPEVEALRPRPAFPRRPS